MIKEKNQLIIDAIRQHLIDCNAIFIDKTGKGGCLYFFDDAIALELRKKGYSVLYAPSGAKATDHQPAWYIRPPRANSIIELWASGSKYKTKKM